MSDYKTDYLKRTEEIRPAYLETIKKISDLNSRTSGKKDEFEKYVNVTSSWILKIARLEEELNDKNYFKGKSFDELYRINKELFEDILPGNYETQYVNPEYSVKIFGEETGRLLSFFSNYFRSYVEYAFEHRIIQMHNYNSLFIKTAEILLSKNFSYESLKNVITEGELSDKTDFYSYHVNQDYNPDMSPLQHIYDNEDFNDLRYLFKYGKLITENEIRIAKHISDYPADKLKNLAHSIVKAYLRGFELEKKDLTGKKTLMFITNVGMEKLSVEIINELKRNKLTPLLSIIHSTSPNKQYRYDHRFDIALYLSEEQIEHTRKSYNNALEGIKDNLREYSGVMMLEKFGEKPFSPMNKPSAIKLNPEQTKQFRAYQMNFRASIDKYIHSNETSFTAVSLPTPEIGDKFEEIFDGIADVNMMDTNHHEMIQKNIIDVLDKAEYVEVKGKGNNETFIQVRLHELKNPDRETNFLNIGADKNIPVGEVFTSPKLQGTNGTLHYEEVFLKGLKFDNLRLTFKDGFIDKYDCTNFKGEEENKKFVEENLLFPNKTLPLGEFAIGTNTEAYKLAKKYKILNILPILIIEKMGPHFAVGDTCFMWQEDHVIHNVIDNKEMIAKDNEKSILRKEDIMQAYTNVHIDMTLPYESIEYIASVQKDGTKNYIIKDGIFVVEGTEELNLPLKNLN